jgi:signal transduction histidine kinase
MTSDNAPQERIDLAAVVQAAYESMAQHTETAGVNLIVEPNGPVPVGDFVVLGSASALRRAITSLIDNALAHEHRGGTIAVALRRHHEHVLVDVRDDGVGIEPGAMETLFNRFSRGKIHTAAGDRPRYGIGLALVREIAHAHRGQIAVAQTPGGGATFTLTIPSAPHASR